MQEIAEFRIAEEYAHLLFKYNEGVRLGDSVRKIEIDITDPKFVEIGVLEKKIQKKDNTYFFSSWTIKRKYNKSELENAKLFLFRPTAYFEPAGEEHGTVYDESTACPSCGAGAKQVGPLFLPVSRIPKGKDIAITIAGEIVVSQRLVQLFKQHKITGVDFDPVRKSIKSKAKSDAWFQLLVRSSTAEIIPPTRLGIDPFDDDSKSEYRCSNGDTIGLNVLSELTIRKSTRGNDDFFSSHQFIGRRAGVLRPERVLFISPKVWKLIVSEKLKGCKVEVAHLS